ncbi:MAG TPA: CDP-alcohol phosphatidyltransferase family protein [Gemmatimonadaceae bacterium]|nr:CDP-alcohol phosphatidyltransferase family protein [Gemmatimonadaceae bacterium]
MTRANVVAITRATFAFLAVAILFHRRDLYLLAALLTIVAIMMDGLDGWVARRYGEVSRIGAVIDILTDRIVELTYWIAFAVIGWIPVWIPIVVAVRGLLVDGARAVAFERGLTAFGPTTMMRSKLGNFLVASRESRSAYGIAKAAAFTLMIVAYASSLPQALARPVLVVALVSVYISVVLCLLRGIPVLLEARRLT